MNTPQFQVGKSLRNTGSHGLTRAASTPHRAISEHRRTQSKKKLANLGGTCHLQKVPTADTSCNVKSNLGRLHQAWTNPTPEALMKKMLAHRSSGGLTCLSGQTPLVGPDQDHVDYPQIKPRGPFTA